MSDRVEPDKVEQLIRVAEAVGNEGSTRKLQGEEQRVEVQGGGEQQGKRKKEEGYIAVMYYFQTRGEALFAVVRNSEKYIKEFKKYIEQTYGKAVEIYAMIHGLQFVKPYVELDLTEPVPARWKISPHCEPLKLYKSHIDNFKSPNWPPCIQLSVYPVDNPVQTLEYKIPLVGVRQDLDDKVAVIIVKSSIEHLRSQDTCNSTEAVFIGSKGQLIDILWKSVPVFQGITLDCETQGLITSSECGQILDTMKNDSAQTRARQLVQYVQTAVKYEPDKLDVFLDILEDKGNGAVKVVANGIATKWKEIKRLRASFTI